MAYIYQIINDINDKIYVGKTEFSIEKRFKEHCRDAFKERSEKRPLYSAMRKYGVEPMKLLKLRLKLVKNMVDQWLNILKMENYWRYSKISPRQGVRLVNRGRI